MAVLTPALADRVADRFRALAEPWRLRILYTLMPGELCVGDVVQQTGGHQANISKHLQLLHQEGLVARRKAGTSTFYRITDPAVFALCDLVCGSLGEPSPRPARRSRS